MVYLLGFRFNWKKLVESLRDPVPFRPPPSTLPSAVYYNVWVLRDASRNFVVPVSSLRRLVPLQSTILGLLVYFYEILRQQRSPSPLVDKWEAGKLNARLAPRQDERCSSNFWRMDVLTILFQGDGQTPRQYRRHNARNAGRHGRYMLDGLFGLFHEYWTIISNLKLPRYRRAQHST